MSTLAKLSPEWSNWLNTSIANNVSKKQLAVTLFENGLIDAALEFMEEHHIESSQPMIDFSKNHISLSDKNVSLIFTATKPMIAIIDNFLSERECLEMISIADTKLQNSTVVDPNTGNFVKHEGRTSTSTSFHRGENQVIQTIESRISELLSWPVENGEGLQVLRYENGGEYKPHYDFFDPALGGSHSAIQKGGQRVGTFLMYLSDVEAGGATGFPILNFQIRPKRGMALYFSNTNIVGEIDKNTMHSSIPVTQGVKYLSTKWLRETAYI